MTLTSQLKTGEAQQASHIEEMVVCVCVCVHVILDGHQ
jgi:hypothetical protein